MYFIVNSENFVIAASEKFIQKIGARDICLISSMYKDGSIVIDEDNKSIKILTKELNLDFEKSKLYSSFGELTHFRLYDKEEKILEIEENDDISYLKKIKKGVIEKEDNEFDIPKIAALEESKEKEDIKELKDEIPEFVSEIENIHILNEEPKEESIATPQNKEQKIDEISSKEENESEIDELAQLKDEILPVEDKQPSKETEEAETINNSENELLSLKEEIESNKEDIEIPPIPIDKVREKQRKKEQLKQTKENEIKEKLVRIEDLTPIEDEMKEDNSDNSLKDEIQKFVQSDEPVETKETQEVERVETQQDELSDIIPLEDSYIQEDNKDVEIEPQKDNEVLNELLHELEVIETKDKDDIATKEEISNSKDDISNVIPKDDIIEPKEDIALNISKEEIVEKKEDKVALKTKSSIDVLKDEDKNIVNKIAKVQVESLDLEDNAKRLNLDLDSYKMLLNSYINEFTRVDEQLKRKDQKTIDMLIDAGQLLALDSVVFKLTKLKNATDASDIEQKAKEIEIYIRELKKKIDGKRENNFVDETIVPKEEPKEKLEIKENIAEVKPNIEPEDEIEKILNKKDTIVPKEDVAFEEKEKDILESDKTLLNSVDKKDITLEIEETAMELNIPENLILEFTKDFLTQSKEHLPILIEEYKKGNVKELQQTAHMLKGAANNLRLNSIADVLFKMQKSSDLEYDKELIIKFASLIKGLEEALNRVERS